jgi:hypothetical protein
VQTPSPLFSVSPRLLTVMVAADAVAAYVNAPVKIKAAKIL